MCVSRVGAYGSVILAATVVANVCEMRRARGKCSWRSKRVLRTSSAMSISPTLLFVCLTESRLQRNVDPHAVDGPPHSISSHCMVPHAAPSNCLIWMSAVLQEQLRCLKDVWTSGRPLLGAKRRPCGKTVMETPASRFAGPALSTAGRVMPLAAPPASMELIFLMAQVTPLLSIMTGAHQIDQDVAFRSHS